MSGPRGTGVSASRRSPPRIAEDRDLQVAHRPSRGLGLPPRIRSSEPRGRGGGGYRGRGRVRPTGWPNIRPSGGSVPPWAERARQVDTNLPQYSPGKSHFNPPPNSDHDTHARAPSPTCSTSPKRAYSPSRPVPDSQPPPKPKWSRELERDQSRAPIAGPSRTLSSSPIHLPLDPAVGLDTPKRYSSGPSHQRWISPNEAGPSNYASRTPRSRTASPALPDSSSYSHQQADTNHAVKLESADLPIDAPTGMPASSPSQFREKSKKQKGKSPEKRSNRTIEDEKEDVPIDEDVPASIEVVEEVEEQEDIKPDLSVLYAPDIPPIPESEREEGVLAFKREEVSACYLKDAGRRTAARAAFRIEKTQVLSAMNRSIQHVLWRDDGVGVQWRKMKVATPRTRPPPTSAGESSTSTRPSDTPNGSIPARSGPLPASSSTTAAIIAKSDRAIGNVSSEQMTVSQHDNPPRPAPTAIPVSHSGPSSLGAQIAHPKQQDSSAIDSPALTKKARKKFSSSDDNKRKADDEASLSTPAKPAKLPKKGSDIAAAGPSMTKAERKALKRAQEGDSAIAVAASVEPKKKKTKEEKQEWKLAKKEEAHLNGVAVKAKNKDKGKGKEVDEKPNEPTLPKSSAASTNGGGSLTTSIKSVKGLPAKPVGSTSTPGTTPPMPSAASSYGRPPVVRPATPPAVRPAPSSSVQPVIPFAGQYETSASPSLPARPVGSYAPRPPKVNNTSSSLARPPRPSFAAPSSSTTSPAPPLPTPTPSSTVRPPPLLDSTTASGANRPPISHQTYYQPSSSGASYSERQALAALARPPQAGSSARPPAARFVPRPHGAANTNRPPAIRPATGRPPVPSSLRPTQASTAGPPPRPPMPSREITLSNVTARYDELRKALSKKMEEIDNWTSMLTDLPDHAGQTERQIERTKAECFVLQKQMREQKEKMAQHPQ